MKVLHQLFLVTGLLWTEGKPINWRKSASCFLIQGEYWGKRAIVSVVLKLKHLRRPKLVISDLQRAVKIDLTCVCSIYKNKVIQLFHFSMWEYTGWCSWVRSTKSPVLWPVYIISQERPNELTQDEVAESGTSSSNFSDTTKAEGGCLWDEA